ncbi:acyltransferase [Mycolicibacterium litorale]|nr:acyltransferase [Mycolicibacterium litorale]
MGGKSLGQSFDPRSNALNACRLAMATGVILYHSWAITGRHLTPAPAHQILRDVWVDGFFAISGFLITWSWFKRPRIRDYFVARSLRILPGLWFCLAVTAFVIAPIGVAIQGGSASKLLRSPAPIQYVLGNSAVMLTQQGIDGSPSGIPVPGVWNGSLWTLIWEVLCYVAVALFGVVGLLRRRWFIPTLLALTLLWSARLPPWSMFADLAETQQAMNPQTAVLFVQAIVARFATMFLAGAFIYQVRNVLPARWWLVGLSVAIVLAASFLPNYRILAAVPLAYAVIATGALVRGKWLQLRTDLSYGVYVYGWPMQQLLVICGLGVLNPLLFAIVAVAATVPLAAISWFVVEKPSISLKTRLGQRQRALTEQTVAADSAAATSEERAPSAHIGRGTGTTP